MTKFLLRLQVMQRIMMTLSYLTTAAACLRCRSNNIIVIIIWNTAVVVIIQMETCRCSCCFHKTSNSIKTKCVKVIL